MKNNTPLYFCFLLATFSACHKSPEPEPAAEPCAGFQVDKTELNPWWSWSDNHDNSIYPAVFENQVIFSRLISPGEIELLSLDGTSGQVRWKYPVSTYLSRGDYAQRGSTLYFTNKLSTALLGLDILTQELKTVWTPPTGTTLSRNCTIRNGFAICPAREDISGDSALVLGYLVDLQNGSARRIANFHTQQADFFATGMLDPQVTITPDGDTIFCFVRVEIDPAYLVTHRLSSWNITRKTIVESDIAVGTYLDGNNRLVVEGRRAWFLAGDRLQCLDVSTGAVIWSIIDKDFKDQPIFVTDGKIICGHAPLKALDANTGALRWEHALQGYGFGLRSPSAFAKDGQLYIIQDYKLVTLDLETGCATGEHALPAAYGQNTMDRMILAPDGKKIYVLGLFKSFAAPLPE